MSAYSTQRGLASDAEMTSTEPNVCWQSQPEPEVVTSKVHCIDLRPKRTTKLFQLEQQIAKMKSDRDRRRQLGKHLGAHVGMAKQMLAKARENERQERMIARISELFASITPETSANGEDLAHIEQELLEAGRWVFSEIEPAVLTRAIRIAIESKQTASGLPSSIAGDPLKPYIEVKILYDYNPDFGLPYLTIRANDRITVTDWSNSDWWAGYPVGIGASPDQVGFLPSKYASVTVCEVAFKDRSAIGIKLEPCYLGKYQCLRIQRVEDQSQAAEFRGFLIPGLVLDEVNGRSATGLQEKNIRQLMSNRRPLRLRFLNSDEKAQSFHSNNKANHMVAVALYNYDGEHGSDYLSISKGDRLLVTDTADDGWWTGYKQSDTTIVGAFPSAYVVVVENPSSE
eukprot:SAG31_NODE_7312_length_1723_cov_2.116995_1_plen_398_part_10